VSFIIIIIVNTSSSNRIGSIRQISIGNYGRYLIVLFLIAFASSLLIVYESLTFGNCLIGRI
jgi:hypothetical protein